MSALRDSPYHLEPTPDQLRVLARPTRFIGGSDSTSLAAFVPMIQLRNPAGSGVVLVIESISVGYSVLETVRVGWSLGPLVLGLSSQVAATVLGASAPLAEIHAAFTAAPLMTQFHSLLVPADAMCPIQVRGPLFLLSGRLITVAGTVAGARTLTANFVWEEIQWPVP